MLESVYGGWLRSLTEREFDGPFSALLRSAGFHDVVFCHGQYEFGKDFIAKRDHEGEKIQYGFQLKAGDITGSQWDKMYAQLDQLPNRLMVHPNFDTARTAIPGFDGPIRSNFLTQV